VTFAARLATAIESSGHLCVGIDPLADVLRSWGLDDSAASAREVGLRAVEAATGRAAAVKPQVAFFERHGTAGYAALVEVLAAARAAGLLIVADVKRGDLDTSVDGYGEAWLDPASELRADAMTAVPYQGVGALRPVLERATATGNGVFVLAATSNPEAIPVQSARRADGRTVASATVDEARAAGHGIVVGATVDLAEVGLSPELVAGMPILAPGYGAQGARLADGPDLFGVAADLVLASASRSILRAGPDGLVDAVTAHAWEARW
jgi:orotidine-5'-phosphate decarboxylase